MSVIYLLNVNEFMEKSKFEQLRQYVSQKCRERADKFYFIEDAKRSIGAELLIRYYLILNYGIANHEIELYYNKYGKPYVRVINDLYFNVSHSCSWIACGLSNKEIGIDVEEIKYIDLDIARSQFSNDEYTYIMECKNVSFRRFMKIWTLKESYVKYVGRGLNIPLDSFTVMIDNEKCTLDSVLEHNKVFLKQTEEIEGYILAECSEDSSGIDIRRLKIEDLLEIFCGY